MTQPHNPKGMRVTRLVQAVIVARHVANNPTQTYREIVAAMVRDSGIDPRYKPGLGAIGSDIENGRAILGEQNSAWHALFALLACDVSQGGIIHMPNNTYEKIIWGFEEVRRHLPLLTLPATVMDEYALAQDIMALSIQAKGFRSPIPLTTVTASAGPVHPCPVPVPVQPSPVPAPQPQQPEQKEDEPAMTTPTAQSVLEQALATLGRVPALTKELDSARSDLSEAQSAIASLTSEIANEREARDRAAKVLKDSLKQQADQDEVIKQLKSELLNVPAPMPVQAATLPGTPRNNLDAIAKALKITREVLDAELQGFLDGVSAPLANPVRWTTWCNPKDLVSKLPFHYRHQEPVFLAGESGTGKTFMAEALAFHYSGRRCCITHHEKISYAKLFIRETVASGTVRSILGPVLLCLLTGTPLIADEIDHADVFIQSLYHELLDKHRLFVPELGLTIYAEDGFRFIATGNSLCDDSGQYHGEVGTALRTRFAGIDVKFPDQAAEAQTIHVATTCPMNMSEQIAKTMAALRGAVSEQKLAGPISVRESCAIGRRFTLGMTDGMTANQAMTLAFTGAVIEKRPRSEQAVAAEIIGTILGITASDFLAGL